MRHPMRHLRKHGEAMATLRSRSYVEEAESYGSVPPIIRSERHRPSAAIEPASILLATTLLAFTVSPINERWNMSAAEGRNPIGVVLLVGG